MILNQFFVEVDVLTDSSAGLITVSGNPVREFKIIDWLDENRNWLFWTCGSLMFIGWVIYNEFGKLLANRKIKVKRIVSEGLEKRGDIKVDEEKITAYFLWTKRTFYWKDITEVSGFSTGDDADGCWDELINIKFQRGITIVFNSAIQEHIEIVNREKNKLGLEDVDLTAELYSADEKKPVIFYKKH